MDQFKPSQRLRIMQSVLLRLDPQRVDMTRFDRCHIGHFCRSPEGESLGLSETSIEDNFVYETVANALGVDCHEFWLCFHSDLTPDESLIHLAAFIRREETKEAASVLA